MTACGFISVLGAPNAGKSTLINSLVGAKVTIVSSKVQTTRNRILGVARTDDAQIILIDTPGIFSLPKGRLEQAMVQSAWDSLNDTDGIMVIVDVSCRSFKETESILERLSTHKKPIILVLNKIDLLSRDQLLAMSQNLSRPFIDRVFMVSALKNDRVQDIKTYLATILPAGPWLFPEDQLSDLPQRLLAAEITREEIFHRLYDELPYAIWVETESWEDFDNGSVKITQCIYVHKESQRAIVLGKGGSQVKAIGQASRKQLTSLLKRPVHLFLTVKVKADWMESSRFYKSVGLPFKN